MLEELDRRLRETKEGLREQRRLQTLLDRAAQSLIEERSRLADLEQTLLTEGTDVDRLEGLSLNGLFHSILGSREQQLEKERREYLTARLKYDECAHAVDTMEREVEDLRQRLAALGDLDERYQALLNEKEEAIAQSDSEAARSLLELSETAAEAQADTTEIQEAVSAGMQALNGLDEVIDALRSAENWGNWDLLGGGLLSTAMKHSRVDDARQAAHRVQGLLRRFERELLDVRTGGMPQLGIEISGLEQFADYFLDNLITDWIVQSRIRDSLSGAIRVHGQVAALLERLQHELEEAKERESQLAAERRELIESL